MKKLLVVCLATVLMGSSVVLKPCEVHHKIDLCWMELNPNGTIYGDE